MNKAPEKISIEFLIANYDVLLLDAFGVLMNSERALPGAIEFIDLINKIKKPYYILSNGSLYSAEQNEVRYGNLGLKIPKERILSSASLIAKWIRNHKFENKHFLVLGPEPTKNRVRDAGGIVIETLERDPDVIVLGDQTGYDLLSGLEHAINCILQSIDKGKVLPILVPNPDVLYPKKENTYGITAGALALVLSRAVELRFPKFHLKIDFLGKPYAPLFEEARLREPKGKLVMVGDQMETDIRGAHNFGIDSVLIDTGVTRIHEIVLEDSLLPTYVMDNFLR